MCASTPRVWVSHLKKHSKKVWRANQTNSGKLAARFINASNVERHRTAWIQNQEPSAQRSRCPQAPFLHFARGSVARAIKSATLTSNWRDCGETLKSSHRVNIGAIDYRGNTTTWIRPRHEQ